MANTYWYFEGTAKQLAEAWEAVQALAQTSSLPHERLHRAVDAAPQVQVTEKVVDGKDVEEKKVTHTARNMIVQGNFTPAEETQLTALGYTRSGSYADGQAESAVHAKLEAEKSKWVDDGKRPKYEVVTEREKPQEEKPVDELPVDELPLEETRKP